MTQANPATAMTLNHSEHEHPENLTKHVEKHLVDKASPDTQLLGL